MHVDDKVQSSSALLTDRRILFVQPRICAGEETSKGTKSPAMEGQRSHGRFEMDEIRRTKQVPSRYVVDLIVLYVDARGHILDESPYVCRPMVQADVAWSVRLCTTSNPW